VDLAKIGQLVDLVSRSRIAELELTQDGTRIRILKNLAPDAPAAATLPRTADRELEAHAAKPQPDPPDVADIIVPAPMHGVFHQAAAPGAPPLVEVGANIEAGQNICVIEAMKTFIGVVAETSGTVLAILVENGDEIEAGQPLFRIRPAGTS